MQDELIEAFASKDFQSKLHKRWPEGDDLVERARVRQEVCLEVQGPIISKYGFEASRRGLAMLLKSFTRQKLGLDPEVNRRALLLEWLVDPGLQAVTPIPIGEAAEGRYAMCNLHGHVKPPPPTQMPVPATPVEVPAPATPAEGTAPAVSARLPRDKIIEMQAELISACIHAGFQETCRSAVAGSRQQESRHEEASMLVQRPILQKYGFLANRRGVQERDAMVGAAAASDPEVSANRALLAWLLKPKREDAGAPERAQGYQIYTTEANDGEAIRGIERCRGALALAHQSLYREAHPGILQQEWLGALGRESIQAFIREGGLMLHAEHKATGEIVGYVSCRCGASEDEEENGHEGAPRATVNHIGVLPDHRCRGVGRMLFDDLLGLVREVCPGADADLRMNVVELNTRAVGWYRRLGFVVVQLWLRRFSVKFATVPVAFLTMQRRDEAAAEPWECFFRHNLKGERLVLLPAASPLGFRAHVASQRWPPLGLSPGTVVGFDEGDRCHSLEDGRWVDLTLALAHGQVIFERPLHAILSGKG